MQYHWNILRLSHSFSHKYYSIGLVIQINAKTISYVTYWFHLHVGYHLINKMTSYMTLILNLTPLNAHYIYIFINEKTGPKSRDWYHERYLVKTQTVNSNLKWNRLADVTLFFEVQLLKLWGYIIEAGWRIYVSKLNIIGSDNGLSPDRRQAIIWTNAGILLIWPLGTHFSDMLIEINTSSFKKIYFKMSCEKWWQSVSASMC